MRRVLVPVVAGAILLVGAAPAAPPDHPVDFITVAFDRDSRRMVR